MTYAELQTAFEGLLKRRDLTSTLRDMWLQEALSRSQSLLRIPAMEASYTVDSADLTNGEVNIPTDYLQLRSFTVTDSSGYEYELDQRDLATVMRQRLDGTSTSTPRYFARRGGVWALGPEPETDQTIRVDYYAEFEELSASTDTNLLSIIKPYAIIYGALSLAADYYLDKRAPAFEARFTQQIDELMQQAAQDELINTAVAPVVTWSED